MSYTVKAEIIQIARKQYDKKRVRIRKGCRLPATFTVKQKKSGFTLLELLVVVGILAALVALALPFYQDYVNQSKMTAAEADLQTFKKALAMYDQLEQKMFNSSDFLVLIGKYMQDFRTYTTQNSPHDPWGVPYIIRPAIGVVLSYGPDGELDTTDVTARLPVDDDIMIIWKPPFIISGIRPINELTVEVSFSRKIDTLTEGTFSVTDGTITRTGISKQKISDSIYRIVLNGVMTKGQTYTATLTTVTAQDTKGGLDTPPGGVPTFKF